MKLMKRLAQTLGAAVLLAVLCPVADVKAGQYITKENFDYEWYLEKHPDLAAIVSAEDHETIWAYYEREGLPVNGWVGRRSKASWVNENNFDYENFLAAYPDVYAAFGNNYKAVYEWYITTGIYEDREIATTSGYTNAIMKIYDIAEEITDSTMSEREKVKAVHDWLCINVDYDYGNYLNGTIPGSSYGVEGVVYYGKAVCSGYTSAFGTFMDVLGIESQSVRGKSGTVGHAWNKVKVDGNWYEIDVTWDDLGLYGMGYRYDYFLISEEQMDMDQDHGIYARE